MGKAIFFGLVVLLGLIARPEGKRITTAATTTTTGAPTTQPISTTSGRTTDSTSGKPTSHPSSQTTSPHASNSTSNTSTTTVTATTPSPVPSNASSTNIYNVTNGKNLTCLKVKMAAYFKQNKTVVNVTSKAEVDKTSNCSTLVVNFGENNFEMKFEKDSNSYYLNEVSVVLGKTSANATNLKWGKASIKASYTCDSGFTFNLTNDITMVATHVQFQAFEVDNDKFGTANTCKSDLSPIIPIVVGAVLAALVVIVIIAYLIGRRRSRTGYEEI